MHAGMLTYSSDRSESGCESALGALVGSGIYRVVPLIAARRSEVAEGLQHVMQSFSRGRLPVLRVSSYSVQGRIQAFVKGGVR